MSIIISERRSITENNEVGAREEKKGKKEDSEKASEKRNLYAQARGVLSILNEPRVALRDSTVGSCRPAIVITRCREHTRRGWTMALCHEGNGTTGNGTGRGGGGEARRHAFRLRTVIDAD